MPKWKVLKSTELFDSGLFRLRSDQCELPDKRIMPKYFVLDFPDWVNVVAVTKDKQMVLVEQYRHAAGEVFLEVPGGSLDSRTEDPRLAGARELLEETGYKAGEIIDCGSHYPNPALQSNRMHSYLALDCEKVAEPDLDPFEDLKVRLMPVAEAFRRWESGEFTHSIISASFGRTLKHLRERGIL